MQAKIQWHTGLRFTGYGDGASQVFLQGGGVDPDQREGFLPLQMMLLALAGCTGMDVISILEKKRQDVTDFSVEVAAAQAEEHPRVFTQITVRFLVTGRDVSEQAVARAIELSSERYCPSTAMLRQAVPIDQSFEIRQAKPQ